MLVSLGFCSLKVQQGGGQVILKLREKTVESLAGMFSLMIKLTGPS